MAKCTGTLAIKPTYLYKYQHIALNANRHNPRINVAAARFFASPSYDIEIQVALVGDIVPLNAVQPMISPIL
jgi:hypothetical protein